MVRVFDSKVLATKVTTILDYEGEPLFKAKDVALSLGYEDPDQAIRRHVREKYKVTYCEVTGENSPVETTGEKVPVTERQNTLFLREPGLYQLIFRSNLPIAREFEDWVVSEVLPSIHKTGRYELKDPISKVLSISLDKLSAYDKEERREYKTIILSRYELLKEEKKKMGRNGGLTTQQRIREERDENMRLKDAISQLFDSVGEITY